MSNLIPEQRPDKNGKLVTRHVKASGGTSLSGSAIPAPSITMKAETPSETIARELRDSGLFSEAQIEDYSSVYLNDKGGNTQQMVADAIVNRKNDREMEAVTKIVTMAMEPGVVQLSVSDVGFFLDLADANPREKPVQSLRAALEVMESTFVATFRPKGRVSDHTKVDYLKYADDFKATALSRMLLVDDEASSVFEAREQVDHIRENMDAFRENLLFYRQVANEIVQHGANISSKDLLGMAEYADGGPEVIEAIGSVVRERRRFDADEIKAVLSTASAISQGAL